MRFIAERIKADALSLARHEREEIARTLTRSVEDEPAGEPGWIGDELRSGRGAMMPGEEFSDEFLQFLNDDVVV